MTIDPEHPFSTPEQYQEYVNELQALGNYGAEARQRARKLLTNADYEARETGAWLLGEFGELHQLGEEVEAVVGELTALINRPLESDPKELQAVGAAISALGKIKHPSGIPILRQVLFSIQPEHDGDNQLEAALALGKIVSEPFEKAADPVEAAREWIRKTSTEES